MIEQALKKYLKDNKIITTSNQEKLIGEFLQIIQSINPHLNLVADSSTETLVNVHLHDSMQIMKMFSDLSVQGRWIDIGSGGGFPGIIAAIMFPSMHITLVESMRKKYSFLLYVLVFTSISNVTVLHERAENVVIDPEYCHVQSVFSARGVGPVEYLSDLFNKALTKTGEILLWKDPKEIEEFLNSDKRWICGKHVVYSSNQKDKHLVCLQRKQLKGDKHVSKGKEFRSSRTRTRNC